MAWPHDAYVGQKVVAVYTGTPTGRLKSFWRGLVGANDPLYLKPGKTYTVAKIGFKYGVVRIFVEEKPARVHYGFALFRPVQKHNRSTETGMEKLRSFLKDAKQKVSEEV